MYKIEKKKTILFNWLIEVKYVEWKLKNLCWNKIEEENYLFIYLFNREREKEIKPLFIYLFIYLFDAALFSVKYFIIFRRKKNKIKIIIQIKIKKHFQHPNYIYNNYYYF